MGRIDIDIRNRDFSNFYLIYGNEEFRKQTYKNKLIANLVSPDDEMNLSKFDGKDIDVEAVVSLAETMPFFAEARVICIQDSGWFKGKSVLEERAAEFPKSTVFIFVEENVSEKSPMFKFIKDRGVCEEVRSMNEVELVNTVQAYFRSKNKMISAFNASYFVQTVGCDMANVQSELYKLTAYCADKQEVTKEDIDEICHPVLETKVYALVDKIIDGKREESLKLYGNMLEEQEDVKSVLGYIISSYSQLYMTARLADEGSSADEIVREVRMRDFVAKKYLRIVKLQIEKFTFSYRRICMLFPEI